MTTRKMNQSLPNYLYFKKSYINFLFNSIILLVFILSGSCLKSQILIDFPCYALSEDNSPPNVLFEYDPESNIWNEIGVTGGTYIEAIATDPITDIIYAVDGDQFGTLDPNTGAFSLIGEGIGVANGSVGLIPLDDIDGLTYDPINMVMYAIQRVPGEGPGTNDLLFQIDVSTGAFIPGVFINSNDYTIVPEVFEGTYGGDVYDVDDIAYNPYTGQLFAIQNQDGPGTITELNIFNGDIEAVIYDLPDDDVEGLGFSYLGELFATTGDNGSTSQNSNTFIFIDLNAGSTQTLNFIDPDDGIPPAEEVDFESFDCMTAFNDLALEMVLNPATPEIVYPGDQVTFLITVYNQGDFENSDIALTNYIPSGLILNDPTWSDLNNSISTVTIPGLLTSGASTTISITFTIDASYSGTSITNYVEITSSFNPDVTDNFDNPILLPDIDSRPNDLNEEINIVDDEINGGGPNANEDEDDHDIATIAIGNSQIFDLALIKQTAPNQQPTFSPGDDITFMITIENQGSADVASFELIDYIPSGMTLSTNDTNGWRGRADGPVANSREALKAGTNTTVNIVLTIDPNFEGKELVNFAEITSFEDSNGNAPFDIDSTPDTNPDNDGESTNNEINNSNGDEDDHDFALINIELSCYESSPDKDGDKVPDNVDLDADNDGILDAVEDGILIPEDCNTTDLTALAGSPAANTTLAGVTIGGATIMLTNTFSGVAGQDEDIINNSQTSGDLGIRQGVIGSSDATSKMFNTYTFSQPVCNLNMTVWDIDRTDVLTVEGSNIGTPVTITVLNIGSLLDSVVGSRTSLITAFEEDNLQDAGGTDYSFTIVFNQCVDQVVYAFNNWGDAGNTSGSYSVTFNEGCSLQVTNSDMDGDGVPNSLDLDSDNDGIPDAIEACGDISLLLEDCTLDFDGDGAYNLNPDGCPNGLLLSVCTQAPIDSDNDGTPDYLDLDSDNDGCADAVEATSNSNPNVNEYTFGNPAVDICGLVLAGTFAPCQVPVSTSWIDPVIDDCNGCPTDGLDKDRDGVPDFTDVDDDNDGILDVDEGCINEPNFCSSPDLSALDGTPTDGLNAFNTTNITIGNAVITATRVFGGAAVLDEDEINTSQTGADIAIRQGLSVSNSPADFVENTYSHSEPVCNLQISIWDIDRTDELTITANGPNGPVTMTLSMIGAELGNDFGDIVAGSGTTAINIVETGNLQFASGPDYAFIVTFDDCVDDVVFTFWNNTDGNNTGGSYSLAFNEGCTLPNDCEGIDTDGDNIPDHLDNDSDNDGIPDAIEACGNITLILDNCTLDNDRNAIYTDTNGDGCIDGLVDFACTDAPIDSDGDGIPNFLDLDSDNDGLADSAESGSIDENLNVNGNEFANPAANVDAFGLVLFDSTPICFMPVDELWINPQLSSSCEHVAGIVFFDNDNDGCQSAAGDGVPNVTVELAVCNPDGTTTVLSSTTTGANGFYEFGPEANPDNVCLDSSKTYLIQISNLPPSYLNSTGDGSAGCNGDEDDSPLNNGVSGCYNPSDDDSIDGNNDIHIDFGIYYSNNNSTCNQFYSSNFDVAPTSNWEGDIRAETLVGETVLGRYHNDQIKLTLNSPTNSDLINICFDLWIFDSWDGTGVNGTDIFKLGYQNEVIFETSFSNNPNAQSFPFSYNEVNNIPSGSGAYTFKPLVNDRWNAGEFMYRICRKFEYNSESAEFSFSAEGLRGGIPDESWALDNVTVSADGFYFEPQIDGPECATGNYILTYAPFNGTAPYTQRLFNLETEISNLNNVPPGIYNYEITDANGCYWNEVVNIPNLGDGPLQLNPDIQPLCAGESNASINLNISGGLADYAIEWSDGNNTAIYNDLPLGNYSVEVTDMLGCNITENFSIVEANPIMAQIDITSVCGSAKASVEVKGGNPPYDIRWSNDDTGFNATGYMVGDHNLTITDSRDCTQQFNFKIDSIRELPPTPAINVNSENIICEGGQVELQASQLDNIIWSTGETEPEIIITQAGIYELFSIGSKGCLSEPAVIEINFPVDPEINVVPVTETVCEGESVSLNVTNATSVSWNNGSNELSLTDNPTQTQQYTAFITNQFGCQYQLDKVIIVTPNEAPAMVTEVLPMPGTADVELPLTLTWGTPSNAAFYDVFLWMEGETEPATPNYININTNLLRLTNLEFDQNYLWRIQAKNNCQIGDNSDIFSFKVKAQSDLAVIQIDIPMRTAVSEGEIQIEWTISNEGFASTGQSRWIEEVYISRDKILDREQDFFVGTVDNMSALMPGESYRQSTTFTIPQGVSGNYYAYVFVDAKKSVAEPDEINNEAFSNYTMLIDLKPYPDLIVENIANPGAAGQIFAGQSGTVQWETINNESTATDSLVNVSWGETVYLSQDSTFNSFNAIPIGNIYNSDQTLAFGTPLSNSAQVTIPQRVTGQYFVCVKTDVSNQIYEYDYEVNNITCSENPITINAMATPDFEVDTVLFTSQEDISERLSFQFEVTNNQVNYQGDFTNYIDVLHTEDRFNKQRYKQRLTNLNFASDTTFIFDYTIPLPQRSGVYQICITADGNDAVFEHQRENNNRKCSTNFTVIVDEEDDQQQEEQIIIENPEQPDEPVVISINYPDLQAESLVIADSLQSGNTESLTYVVSNAGEYPINNQLVIDQLLIAEVDDIEQAIALRVVSNFYNLQPGEADTINTFVEIPNDYEGTYFIFLKTDFNNFINENERLSNNIINTTSLVQLSDSPNLVPQSIEVLEGSFESGGFINLDVTVANSGKALIVDDYTDAVYLSRSNITVDRTAILLKQLNNTAIVFPDSSYNLNFNVNIPANTGSGEFYLHYVADAFNKIYESNEFDNDTITEAISINPYPPIDLAAIEAEAKGTFVSGQVLQLNFTVQNADSLPTLENSWMDALYLSLDENFDPSTDILVDSWKANYLLDAGESYSKNVATSLPYNLQPDSYYLFLVADFQQRFDDPDLSNNVIMVQLNNTSTGEMSTNVTVENMEEPNLVIDSLYAPLIAEAGQSIEVFWHVNNLGLSNTIGNWSDAVTLNNSLLQQSLIDTTLTVGADYEQSLQVDIPVTAEGFYELKVTVNANGFLNELTADDNSLSVFIQVIQPPPCDLRVQEVVAPPLLETGTFFNVSWQITNKGDEYANGNFYNGIYLSEDTLWDSADVFLKDSINVGTLAPKASLQQTVEVCITDAAFQNYHIVVKTDLFNNIIETNENNNTGASAAVAVNVLQLEIGVEESNELKKRKPLYYRIEVPDSLTGETLQVLFNTENESAINEIFIAHQSIPTRAIYDYGHLYDLSANQELIVPSLEAGTYYLMAYSNNSPQNINLLAQIIPFEIKTVFVDKGGDIGLTTVEITGAKFEPGMQFLLENESDTINQINAQVIDPTLAYVTFNLLNQPNGQFDVSGIRLDDEKTALTDVFEIVPGIPAELVIDVDYPERVRVNRNFSMIVKFSNAGNVDLVLEEKVLIGLDGIPVSLNIEDLQPGISAFLIDDDPFNNSIRPGEVREILMYSNADRVGKLNYKIK